MKSICGKCGQYKEGAWKACGNCGFIPVSTEDKATHLLLSSHFTTLHNLEKFSNHLKSGQALAFQPKDLEIVKETIYKKEQSKKKQRIYLLKLFGCFLLSIIAMIAFYYFKK